MRTMLQIIQDDQKELGNIIDEMGKTISNEYSGVTEDIAKWRERLLTMLGNNRTFLEELEE